ncbi:hypothetical protein [Escherichia coli]|uniref:hypothetical protein n=1 Tax=Escherichia coli TaxID=562 RepID=UPI00164EEAB6|nr:hypothetical protein [Escherichia coli]MCZ0555201.1 hypothetical protein [Escherichia coli]MDZ9995096.1 hypothetical protein [Escherichia coli]HBV0360226.1 hypothetical protein [Escherichia coli]
MIKMTNCTASNCGVGYVFGKGVDAELINSHARACKIGFVQAGNEKEWSILLEKLLTKKADFESLLTVCETVNSEDKKNVISKSNLFEYLSHFANATTVYTFLEGLVNSLLSK